MSLNEEVMPNEEVLPTENQHPTTNLHPTTNIPGEDFDPILEFGEYNEHGVFIYAIIPGSDPPRRYTDPRPRNPNACDELTGARVHPEVLEQIASQVRNPPGLAPTNLETHRRILCTANVGLGPMCAEPLDREVDEETISDAAFDSPLDNVDFSFLDGEQEEPNQGPGPSTNVLQGDILQTEGPGPSATGLEAAQAGGDSTIEVTASGTRQCQPAQLPDHVVDPINVAAERFLSAEDARPSYSGDCLRGSSLQAVSPQQVPGPTNDVSNIEVSAPGPHQDNCNYFCAGPRANVPPSFAPGLGPTYRPLDSVPGPSQPQSERWRAQMLASCRIAEYLAQHGR